MDHEKLIPYKIIIAAKRGNSDAMKTILEHYDKFIDYHSRRTVHDEKGESRIAVDPEVKRRIQAKVIDKIIYDFDICRLPEGESIEE